LDDHVPIDKVVRETYLGLVGKQVRAQHSTENPRLRSGEDPNKTREAYITPDATPVRRRRANLDGDSDPTATINVPGIAVNEDGLEYPPDSNPLPRTSAAIETVVTEPLKLHRLPQTILVQHVLAHLDDHFGSIWFGSPFSNWPPVVSFELPNLLCDAIIPLCEETEIFSRAQSDLTTTSIWNVRAEDFKQLVQRPGYGTILLNGKRSRLWVTMSVRDPDLLDEYKKVGLLAS